MSAVIMLWGGKSAFAVGSGTMFSVQRRAAQRRAQLCLFSFGYVLFERATAQGIVESRLTPYPPNA